MRVQNGRATVKVRPDVRTLANGTRTPERTLHDISQVHQSAAPALDFTATKAAIWLSLTAFLACWCCTSSASTRARRRCSGRHLHPRVRARRTSPPRLPLPLTAGEPTTMEKRSSGAVFGRRRRGSARVRLREDLRRARHRSGHRLRGRHGRRPRSHGAAAGRARVTARAASCSAADPVQVGMGFGVLLFSVAMGALFAVVFAVAYGRVGTFGPRALGAGGGRHADLAVDRPALKYPPNPPATSED